MSPDAYTPRNFADTVLRDYQTRRSAGLLFEAASHGLTSRSTAALASKGLALKGMGHPSFDDLSIGERRTADVTCVFIDLSDFTGRSYWDDPAQVTDLAHSVLTGFTQAVTHFGGFPLGLRGDGIFAAFGPSRAQVAVAFALGACAFALNAVRTEVNPRLADQGIEPVKARAGLDYGRIDFVRTGDETQNEINPSGFAANFAAKCEKFAGSWEIVVGQTLTEHLDDTTGFTQHKQSPKTFTRNYDTRTYRFYDWDWEPVLPHLDGALRELDRHPVAAVSID